MYFNQTLFSHGTFTETAIQRHHGYVTQSSPSYARQENLKQAAFDREDYRNMTMADIEKRPEIMPRGTPEEVAMPHEVFLNHVRRFGQEVLPRLQAHLITRVPAAEEVMA